MKIEKTEKGSCIWLMLVLLCLTAGSTTLLGQQKVRLSGRVTDTDGQPVEQATIAVENTATGCYSQADGSYELEVTPGRQVVVVSFVGYETQKVTLRITGSMTKDFCLKESSVGLGAVEVYGKSQTQKLKESAFAVNALDVKAMASSLNNLNDLVNRTTGIKVREEGGVGSDFDLSINGLSGNSVRYFLDGMPLSSKGSDVTLANLPVNIIDRIEIYKGVVPAHLGTDALGGAINIITKQEKKNYLDVSYGIGSFHTHKADLNAQLVERRTGLIIRPTLGINYSKNDYRMKNVEVWDEEQDQYVYADRKRFHDDYFSLLGQVEIGFANRPWADAFFVSGSYSKVDKELQTGAVQTVVYGMAERQTDAWNISARYQKRDFLVKGLQMNASLSHTWDHSLTVDTAYRKYNWNGDYIVSSRNEITGNKRSMRHYKRPMTLVHINADYALNSHHNFNVDYSMNRTGNDRYDDVDTDFVPSNDVLTKHIIGLSYHQSFFSDRWNNTFFVKDYVNHANIRQTDSGATTGSNTVQGSLTKNYGGYGVGTRFTFIEPFSLKASFEHSVRLPIARELLGNGTTVYANVALEPEQSNNANLGFFGTWRPAAGHTLYYEANGFLRNVDNFIQVQVIEKEGMLQYKNVPAVHIKGAEGEVRYNWQNKLQISGNLSYQDARDQQQYKTDGKPSATYNNRLPNRPWLFGGAEVNYVFHHVGLPDSRLRLNFNYQWVHWYFLTWEAYGSYENKSRIPTQHICNAGVSYSWKNDCYSLSLECSNLLDQTAYDNYKLQKPGRAFFAKFRLFIN